MFSLGSFSEGGQKQKTEKKKEERERLNDGTNNGQLRIANATSGGARKALGQQRIFVGIYILPESEMA